MKNETEPTNWQAEKLRRINSIDISSLAEDISSSERHAERLFRKGYNDKARSVLEQADGNLRAQGINPSTIRKEAKRNPAYEQIRQNIVERVLTLRKDHGIHYACREDDPLKGEIEDICRKCKLKEVSPIPLPSNFRYLEGGTLVFLDEEFRKNTGIAFQDILPYLV